MPSGLNGERPKSFPIVPLCPVPLVCVCARGFRLNLELFRRDRSGPSASKS